MFRRSQQPLIQGRLTINKRHKSRQQQILRHDEVVQMLKSSNCRSLFTYHFQIDWVFVSCLIALLAFFGTQYFFNISHRNRMVFLIINKYQEDKLATKLTHHVLSIDWGRFYQVVFTVHNAWDSSVIGYKCKYVQRLIQGEYYKIWNEDSLQYVLQSIRKW